MPTPTNNAPTTVAYAQALLDLATEQNQAEPTGQELHELKQLLAEFPAFYEFLRNPAIGAMDRTDALKRIFGGRVSPLMWNFLQVLNNHDRLRLLPDLAGAYDDLLAERQGRVEVDVTTAHPLDPDQVEQVRQRVGEALGKQVVLHPYVDDSIIGGLILRVGDRLIDASVRQQLQAIRKQLLTARGRVASGTVA